MVVYPMCDICVPCLLGKRPRKSYDHFGHRPSAIGHLLVIGYIGSASNANTKWPLHLQSQHSGCTVDLGFYKLAEIAARHLWPSCLLHWVAGTDHWMQGTCCRCDGAREFVMGRVAEYLRMKGIQIQQGAAARTSADGHRWAGHQDDCRWGCKHCLRTLGYLGIIGVLPTLSIAMSGIARLRLFLSGEDAIWGNLQEETQSQQLACLWVLLLSCYQKGGAYKGWSHASHWDFPWLRRGSCRVVFPMCGVPESFVFRWYHLRRAPPWPFGHS